MKRIQLTDKIFELSIPFDNINQAIDSIAVKMNKELKDKNPLFICVLNGSFMFAADLMKKLTINCQISFVKLSSYDGLKTTGKIKSLIGLDEDLKRRTIVILEDIVDTGITINNMVNQLKEMQPEKIKIASLFYKPEACQINIDLDYVGLNIPNDFVVGYGLDYNGYGRNLRDLYSLVKNEQ